MIGLGAFREGLFRLADCSHVDSELLALFVEVAALEAERLGRVRHVVMIALELREQSLAFESFHASSESA